MLLMRVICATCAVVFALSLPPLGATKTAVVFFTPWAANELREGFKVTERAPGQCFTQSLVTDRSDAWRCFEGDDILDPCFSSGAHALTVACSQSAFSKRVVILTLSERLPGERNPTTTWLQPKGEPWGLRLANGDTCVFVTGGTDVIAGERMNYACKADGWIIGFPDRSTAQWTARSSDYPSKRITRVSIATAVF